MKKRIIAIILCICLSMLNLTYVSAKETNSNPFEPNEMATLDEAVVEDEKGNEIKVIGGDLENGDMEVIKLKDDRIILRLYLDRSENTLYRSEYENGHIVANTEITYEPAIKPGIAPAAYRTLGRIEWNWTDGYNAGVCKVRVGYEKTQNSADRYNINGVYQDFETMVLLVGGVFGFSFIPGKTIVKDLLAGLGILNLVGVIRVPDCYVSASSTTLKHRVTDMSSPNLTNTITGTKYVVTQDGRSKGPYYDGQYYTDSAFTNKDPIYGNLIYHSMFTYLNYSIKYWGAL